MKAAAPRPVKPMSLTQFLIEKQRDKHPINADLRLLIEVVARACKSISIAVGKRTRRAQRAGKRLDRLRTWAIAVADRRGFNKAAVGLANKLARIAWATWKHERTFDADHACQYDAVMA